MKAAILYDIGKIRIKSIDSPIIEDNEVLVRVYNCGICGTDFHIYKGEREAELPLIQGHEISGEVISVGSQATKLKVGDRVVVQPNISCGRCYLCKAGKFNLCKQRKILGINASGGFAEIVKAPEDYVWKIPDTLSYEVATLVEPYTVAIHAIDKANLKIGEKLIIVGSGVIGLLVLHLAKKGGAQVGVVDILPQRLDLASQWGADLFVDASKEDSVEVVKSWSEGGTEVVIESAGVPKAQEQAIDMLSPGGKLILIGQSSKPMKISSIIISRKELQIIGSLTCLQDFPRAIYLINQDRINLVKLITHQFSLEEIDQAYKAIEDGEAIKAIINCR